MPTIEQQLRQEGILIGRQEGEQKGIQKGIQKGKQEGLQERSSEIAVRMLKDGLDVAFISKYTGLSEDEVLAIKNTNTTVH